MTAYKFKNTFIRYGRFIHESHDPIAPIHTGRGLVVWELVKLPVSHIQAVYIINFSKGVGEVHLM